MRSFKIAVALVVVTRLFTAPFPFGVQPSCFLALPDIALLIAQGLSALEVNHNYYCQ